MFNNSPYRADMKASVRKLEHENADLRFLNNQYVHKLRSQEKESKQKSDRILQLQEKNFHAVVQTPGSLFLSLCLIHCLWSIGTFSVAFCQLNCLVCYKSLFFSYVTQEVVRSRSLSVGSGWSWIVRCLHLSRPDILPFCRKWKIRTLRICSKYVPKNVLFASMLTFAFVKVADDAIGQLKADAKILCEERDGMENKVHSLKKQVSDLSLTPPWQRPDCNDHNLLRFL